MKRTLLFIIVISLTSGLLPSWASDSQPLQAIRAGKIMTVSGGVIDDGVILIREGKIAGVGANLEIPAEAEVLDASNMTITPGFIDAHCHLGLSADYRTEINETVQPVTAAMQIVDAFDPTGDDLKKALHSGVTAAMIAPGQQNPIAGQVAVVKLSSGDEDAWLLKRTAGVKFSFANDALMYDRKPTSRPGLVTLVREHLEKAKAFTPGTFDPSAEALHRVTGRELPAYIYAQTIDEISSALPIIDQYELKTILLGARQADEIAWMLVDRDISVIYSPLLLYSRDRDLRRPAQLAKAGAKIAFASSAPETCPGDIRTSAVLAVRYGLDRQEALKALTLHPAEMLGVAERLGSIEEGKDADLVAFGGDPLELSSPVEMVVVDGRVVYRREQK